ncbi:hypothetical protein GLAREA_02387 [Glarea lozoyensis ATCC 20868]|uniref:X-Pro dipeptidyl-peptidase n=1 Tax=Glarea lozoyensis (strain ATCC 20868 / MF5171) TaxID=1116229 RepID=S3CMN7_GLAL2|nr:uncharacterized protein GLAREA_02387 [Glarea lozoyensis ATCC 20868]EPE26474.1 hypothetical protein GLAREA_02387 [Glarea lozoyensis ATCC 20868]
MRHRIEIPQQCAKEDMRERIERVTADLQDIENFYDIQISETRHDKLKKYCNDELKDLENVHFNHLDQGGRVDYLLLRNYLKRQIHQLELEKVKNDATRELLEFTISIVKLCEDRQKATPIEGKNVAIELARVGTVIDNVKDQLKDDDRNISKPDAFYAAKTVDQLRERLEEWYNFYNLYDPLFSWWVTAPYEKVKFQLATLASFIREHLVGMKPGDEDTIVGNPIGRKGLLADLEAEMVPYTPEELIEIGESEYIWCEAEMKKASNELGYGDDWRAALEHVKNLYVEPGQQVQLVHQLAQEATTYVQKHDLVTVPPICSDLWRTFMMTPARQKINPFFLGGTSIIISYPTSTMDHASKLMIMRGNNIHFSRSTVFHELIPGHHLQFHMKARHKPYRNIFSTPFWIEGWSLYWEMILWDKGFPVTAENKIGMLFWRMHRCARIIFSIKFHLGQMSPVECIDFLVEKVGHERFTAEGEVRRSFNGDYSPLYQAGYMLGALQLYELRKEVVDSGGMTEKQFHDRVLKENEMPIELFRALIKDLPLRPDYESCWKFYSFH